ncbi:RNA polymerase sigma factor [Peristeroidobacter soli]|uniref:RNA polymerase sigma factor n=1 Tax=Peristeroidobacter soli TaxID=2497877 RepID=UPI00101D1588|nr:RNA polymerase sigma factor [Peristeroidobacter soli]
MERLPTKAENSGVPAALEDIFRRCSPDLRRYVQKRLRRAGDVADLTQEIFERFIRGDWQARVRNPAAYLFGIASNVVADARMAEHRNVVTYDSEAFQAASESASAGTTTDADTVALQEELTRALEQLPEVHRVALLLTKRDGLSSKEAAQRMGTTEGSVRVYVCEARARLKTLLKQRS